MYTWVKNGHISPEYSDGIPRNALQQSKDASLCTLDGQRCLEAETERISAELFLVEPKFEARQGEDVLSARGGSTDIGAKGSGVSFRWISVTICTSGYQTKCSFVVS